MNSPSATSSESSNFSFVPQNVITVSTPVLSKKNTDANTAQGAKSVTFPERYKFGENRLSGRSQNSTPNRRIQTNSQNSMSSKFSDFSEPGSSSSMNSQFNTQSSVFPSISEPPPLPSRSVIQSSTNSSRMSSISEDTHSYFPTSTTSNSSFLSPISEDSKSMSSYTTTGTGKSNTSSSLLSPIKTTTTRSSSNSSTDKSSRSQFSSSFKPQSKHMPSSFLPISQILGSSSDSSEEDENTETNIMNSKQSISNALEEEEEEDFQAHDLMRKVEMFKNQISSDVDEEEEEEDYKSIIKNPISIHQITGKIIEEEEEEDQNNSIHLAPYNNLRSSFKQQQTPFSQEKVQISKLQQDNKMLIQSLQKLTSTIMATLQIQDQDIDPNLFGVKSAEEIAEQIDTLCDVHISQSESVQGHDRGYISDDVKELADSIIDRIRGYETKLEKQHRELVALLK